MKKIKFKDGLAQQQINELAVLMIASAIDAPLRRNKYSVVAYVPWELIEDARNILDRAGFDWRSRHHY